VDVKKLLSLAAGVVTLLTGLAGTARSDVLPPGSKSVRHDAVFENVNDYPDHVFFLWPRDLPRSQPGNSSVRVAATGEATLAGNPLARAQHGGPFLFAVPKGRFGGDPSQPPKWGGHCIEEYTTPLNLDIAMRSRRMREWGFNPELIEGNEVLSTLK
jgi:hypothetical protein